MDVNYRTVIGRHLPFTDEFKCRFRCRVVPASPSFWRKRPRWKVEVDASYRGDRWENATDRIPLGMGGKFRSPDLAEREAQHILDRLEIPDPNRQSGIPVGTDPVRAVLEELDKVDERNGIDPT